MTSWTVPTKKNTTWGSPSQTDTSWTPATNVGRYTYGENLVYGGVAGVRYTYAGTYVDPSATVAIIWS